MARPLMDFLDLWREERLKRSSLIETYGLDPRYYGDQPPIFRWFLCGFFLGILAIPFYFFAKVRVQSFEEFDNFKQVNYYYYYSDIFKYPNLKVRDCAKRASHSLTI